MLDVNAIDLHYGAAPALRGVSLHAEPGKVTCVLGRNGVGKTSLLRAIVGEHPIGRGHIRLNGEEISTLRPDERARRGVGYLPQGREIFPLLTVAENLQTGFAPLRRSEHSVPDHVFSLFPVLQSMLRRRGGDLSGGQQQQLAIGRALGDAPTIIAPRRTHRGHSAFDHQGYRSRHRLSAQPRADGDRAGRAMLRLRPRARRLFCSDGARNDRPCVQPCGHGRSRPSARARAVSAPVLTSPRQAALHTRVHSELPFVPFNRSVGRLALEAAVRANVTHRVHLREEGALRLRFPPGAGRELEAVMLNTAGGVAGGDRLEAELHVGGGAHVVATTAAAEKIYRTLGPPARIDVRLTLESRATLDWMPQETILFNQANLRRRLEADVATDAKLLLFEALVFGRAASGETVEQGRVEDRWRIRRDGRLIYADSLRFSGSIAELLRRPAIAAGARALATVLYVAPDAEARLDSAREIIDKAACSCGASAWNGFLTVRFLAETVETLRRDAGAFLGAFCGKPLPRVWQS